MDQCRGSDGKAKAVRPQARLTLALSAFALLGVATVGTATTYYSAYGTSRTHSVSVSRNTTHNFQVDGIAQYMSTEWYVNGVYTGSAQNDYSGFWAIDPEYTYTFSSGTTEIKALVYYDDWTYKEYHKWTVTVPDNPPTNPTSFSSSPSTNTWTTDNTVYVSWSGATDDFGLSRYYYKWTTSSSSSVTTSDSYVSTTSGSGSQTSSALSDSSSWYFHIRYRDSASQLATSTAHYGPFRIDRTAPSNPSSYSSSPSASTWTTDNTVYVSWSGASDGGSGVDGYSILWSTSSSSTPDTTRDTTGTSTTSSGLADGTWYLHVRTVDKVGNWASGAKHCGPFRIDRTDPGLATHQSPSNNGTVQTLQPTVSWLGASDGSGSGVVAYHLKVVEDWGFWIDKVDKDVTGTSYTLSSAEALGWENPYTWRLYAIDAAGNTGSYTTQWRFTPHDTIPPTNPTTYTSSPSANTWTTDNTVYVSWSGATDTGSGVDGYSYQWSTSSTTVPTTTKDTSGTSTTSSGLADGTWYLHVRTVDKAGNWASGAKHCGPFRIDRTDPGLATHQAPSNNGTVSTLQPTVTWSPASDGSGSGVVRYHLKVVESWFPYIDKVDKDVTGTSYTLTSSEALAWVSTYTWRLYAIDAVGNTGSYTTEWRFTVRDTIKPTNPTSYTSDPAVDTWSDKSQTSVTWSGARDDETGIRGYSVVVTQSPTTVPDTTMDTTGTSAQIDHGVGVFTNIYFHVRAVDNADNWANGAYHIGPFKHDREDPGLPTHLSPTNGTNVTTLRPTLTWSAASDGFGSGVVKYRLKVYENWGFFIDKVDKDVTGTSYTLSASEALQWGKNYGWKLYAVDAVGHDSGWTSDWTFTVADTIKPTNPTSYTSDPAVDTWSDKSQTSVTWSGARDDETGIKGYSVVVTQSPTTVPDTTMDTTGTSAQIDHGVGVFTNIYFHVRAVDNANNWADGAFHIGPFKHDRENPGKPVQLSPPNGSTVDTSAPTLEWQAADDGLGSGVTEYHLKVFENWGLFIDKVDGPVTGTTYPLSGLEEGREYGWRLYAIDAAGNRGEETGNWYFTVNGPEIVSAYWWAPLDAPQGSLATMCAEVRNVALGTRFSFEIREDDGWLGSDYITTTTGDAYEDGGKLYVKADWTTDWRSDQAGGPEFFFIVSNTPLGISKTSDKARKNELRVLKRMQPTTAKGEFELGVALFGQGYPAAFRL